MTAPSLVAFDLDDTLATSKAAITPRIAALLQALLHRVDVAIISGGNETQFRTQVIAQLTDADAAALGRLHLLPTCGTRYLRHDGTEFATVYAHDLTGDEKSAALTALREEAERLDLWEAEPWGEILEDRGSQITFSALGQRAPSDAKHAWDPSGAKRAALREEADRLGLWETEPWGEILEDRGSQITFSALGQKAPGDAKHAWDPTGAKRLTLRDAVAARVPDLEVRAGGSTSIDITRAGIDKAYGMTQLAEFTGIPLSSMLFYGDRLDEGGNDYPVLALGVPSVAVDGWEDTADKLDELLKAL